MRPGLNTNKEMKVGEEEKKTKGVEKKHDKETAKQKQCSEKVTAAEEAKKNNNYEFKCTLIELSPVCKTEGIEMKFDEFTLRAEPSQANSESG